MAQVDVTISDGEYNQMKAVFDAVRAKMAPLRLPLRKLMASQPDKVKAFAQTENGRLLREVFRMHRDLKAFAEAVRFTGE